MTFTAVVLAGDRTADDPVARAAGAPCKSLTPIGGTPMVLRVLDALGASREVGAQVLCGPRRDLIDRHDDLRARVQTGQVRWVAPQATPSASAQAAMADLPAGPVLLTTADHALLSPAMIDYFCAKARATGGDVVVGLARHESVRAAYPGTRRTVVKLRDGGYCSCNLFAFVTPAGQGAVGFWRRVEKERKRPLRVIAGVLGPAGVLRYALGRLGLEDGLRLASRRLGLEVRAVVLPFPEAAIDIDTVEDLMLVRALVGGPAR